MKCLICNSKQKFFFFKEYKEEPYCTMMEDIGKVEYYKCINCGFTISKTHKNLSKNKFEKLNYDFHHYLENNNTIINQPPYLEQAMMLQVLAKNAILDVENILDYAGGYGTLSKIFSRYFTQDLQVYDPYIKNNNFINYINQEDLKIYKTVITSALFEHLLDRKDLDEIDSLVYKQNGGAMIIHTVICENIPNNPNWFYLNPPVHTTFHTNNSMNILMNQWGYQACIYCLPAKSWILLRKTDKYIKERISQINKELQTEYLIYKESFVDYWKGFE